MRLYVHSSGTLTKIQKEEARPLLIMAYFSWKYDKFITGRIKE